jgi:hypothetical protein
MEQTMTLLSAFGHHPAPLVLRRPAGTAADRPAVNGRVYLVQRLGAVAVASILLVFGLLGATGGVPFLSTHGARYLGMSSNGLLSALSLVVAVVLLGAALAGPRIASTVMIVLGALFLLSGLFHLAVLNTAANLLAFRMSNVVFSFVVGLLLLVLGAYGRISGHLPADSPYAHPRDLTVELPDPPVTAQEVAAEAAMRQAEIAVVQHCATEDQRRRVQAMGEAHTRADRRRIWMAYDASPGSDRLELALGLGVRRPA